MKVIKSNIRIRHCRACLPKESDSKLWYSFDEIGHGFEEAANRLYKFIDWSVKKSANQIVWESTFKKIGLDNRKVVPIEILDRFFYVDFSDLPLKYFKDSPKEVMDKHFRLDRFKEVDKKHVVMEKVRDYYHLYIKQLCDLYIQDFPYERLFRGRLSKKAIRKLVEEKNLPLSISFVIINQEEIYSFFERNNLDEVREEFDLSVANNFKTSTDFLLLEGEV